MFREALSFETDLFLWSSKHCKDFVLLISQLYIRIRPVENIAVESKRSWFEKYFENFYEWMHTDGSMENKIEGVGDEERLFGRTEWSSKSRGGSYRWDRSDYCRGSGKTRVLTYRIAHLLEKSRRISYPVSHVYQQGCPGNAWKDWTQREQKQKLMDGYVPCGVCKILRIESEKLGFPSNFTIYDTDDSKSLLKDIVREQGLDDKILQTRCCIEQNFSCEKQFVFMERISGQPEFRQWWSFQRQTENRTVVWVVCQAMFQSVGMDFDDLLFQYVSPVVKVSGCFA